MGLFSRWLAEAGSEEKARAAQDPAARVRKALFASFPVGDGLQITFAARGPEQTLLPAAAVDFLRSCNDFRPAEEHLDRFAAAVALPDPDYLARWIPRLRSAGLLVSAAEFLGQWRADTAGDLPPLSMLGFPTGNRPEMALACVEGFAANAARHGRRPELVIADNSSERAQLDRARAGLEALGRKYGMPVAYCGPEEKRAFAGLLAQRAGCDPAVVEFALFDPEGVGFACGANRNALLLHGVGRLVSSIDDDMRCEIAEPPEAGRGLALFAGRDPFWRDYFENRARALEAVQFADHDYCGLHERFLGRTVGDCTRGFPDDELDLDGLRADLLYRLGRPPTRVAVTYTGHVGDPGVPTSYFFLGHTEENLRRLTASEPLYRAALRSRSVFTAVTRWHIGDGTVSPGMAMGLDLRSVLPPFLPVLHAEDSPFGVSVWSACPDSFQAHLPFALHHAAPPDKPILTPGELGPDNRALIFEFAHVVRLAIGRYHPGAADDTAEARLRGMGRTLRALGEGSQADFREHLRHMVLDNESGKARYLEGLFLRADLPDWWRLDVEQYLELTRESLTCEDYDIPHDLKQGRDAHSARQFMRRMMRRFGELLEAWPGLFRAAGELAAEGRRLGA